MADKQVGELTAASALDGTELVHVVQAGNSRRTTAQAVADLGGGGAWQLAGVGQTATGIWDQSVDGSKANVDFTDLDDFSEVILVARLVTKQTSGALASRVSVDNGSTFLSSSGDYQALLDNGTETAADSILLHSDSTTLARSVMLRISCTNVNGAPKVMEVLHRHTTNGGDNRLVVGSTSPINAVRMFGTGGGNLTGGEIYCFAR